MDLRVEDILHVAVLEVDLSNTVDQVDQQDAESNEEIQPFRRCIRDNEYFEVSNDDTASENGHPTGHKVQNLAIFTDSDLLTDKDDIDDNVGIDKGSNEPKNNGSEVEYFSGNGVYRNRGSQVVRLNRQGLSRSQTGEYHCLIPDLIGRNQSIFITIIGKICSICTSILLYIYIQAYL